MPYSPEFRSLELLPGQMTDVCTHFNIPRSALSIQTLKERWDGVVDVLELQLRVSEDDAWNFLWDRFKIPDHRRPPGTPGGASRQGAALENSEEQQVRPAPAPKNDPVASQDNAPNPSHPPRSPMDWSWAAIWKSVALEPGLKPALWFVVVVALLAIIGSFKVSLTQVGVSSLVGLFFMVLIVVVFQLQKQVPEWLKGPMQTFTWAAVILAILVMALIVTGVFFDWPQSLSFLIRR